MINFSPEEHAYNEAKKRLKEERAFYLHLAIYIFMNIALIIFQFSLKDYINSDWFLWITISRPILWGLGLLGHGLWTFRRQIKWLKKSIYSSQWEKRKIEEIMQDDEF